MLIIIFIWIEIFGLLFLFRKEKTSNVHLYVGVKLLLVVLVVVLGFIGVLGWGLVVSYLVLVELVLFIFFIAINK